MEEPIKVLLVDDHVVVRAGYQRLLKSAPDIAVAGEADSGEQAYRLVAHQPVDVAVMDLSLPGMSGIEAASRMRRRQSGVRVLMFSVHEEEIFVQRALDAGADGYLTKRAVADMLATAVREVAAGRRYIDPSISLPDGAGDTLSGLSRREFEIFRLLAEGYNSHAIAEALFLSHKTVANYASQLRAKLGTDSDAELTRLAIRRGIIAA